MRVLLPAASLLVAAACASVPPGPVPVIGPAASLAGEWRGSYESPQSGRAGSILFTLVEGEDHAHGDVVMVPSGRPDPLQPADRAGPGGPAAAPAARPLTVEFVRVSGAEVFGSMAPYTDPDCGCTAVTTFEGRISGDVIRGTFTVRHAGGAGTVTGTWSVRRTR